MKPTKPGFYWFRDGRGWVVAEVFEDGFLFCYVTGSEIEIPVGIPGDDWGTFDNQWGNEIIPPEDKQ